MRLFATLIVLFAALAPPALAGVFEDAKAGLVAQKRGNCSEAIRLYTRAIDTGGLGKGNLAVVYGNRGICRRKSGQIDSALSDYREAIRLNPKNPSVFYNRGIAYAMKGEHRSAIRDYTTAIRMRPKYPLAYNNRGVAQRKIGREDLALADYTKAIRLKSNYATAYANRCLVFETRKNFNQAVLDCRTALRHDRKEANAKKVLKRLGLKP